MTVIIITVVVLALIVIYLYNKLIKLNVRCNNAWSGIDNQLKRRVDLIPNLVEITKSYAKYESETLVKCINARSNSITDKARNSEEISNNLTKLLAVAEKYPDLKASDLFKNLQIELTGTEDKIAFARQFYNDCVQHYNTMIEVFPTNIFAKIMKLNKKDYFKVSETDKQVVEVKL